MSDTTSIAAGLWSPRRTLIAGVLALGALILAFLWRPIASIDTHLYTSGDMSQVFPLTTLGPDHTPANELLSDPVTEMQPWLMFNRSELGQGRLALINPWNGGGVPHLANAQSAVLSPFSVPFYVMPFRLALIVSAFLKILTAGLFTLLFLRALGIGFVAAFGGAVIFAFCGHNLLLLSYPHAGAAALLPATLYFAERVLARHEQAQRLDRFGLAGLAASFALCGLAGQPEPLFFAALLTCAYVVVRIGGRVWRARERAGELRAVRPVCVALIGASVLALFLCAIQILPFVEYMRECRLLEQRTGTQTPLLAPVWPLYAFPNVLGNPANAYYLGSDMPPYTFESANLGYVGSIALCLAALSFLAFLRGKRNPVHVLLAGTIVVWVLWAYDLWHLNRFLVHVPVLGLAPINRSHFLLAFCAAACAAFAIEELSQSSSRSRWIKSGALIALAIAFQFTFTGGAKALVADAIGYIPKLPYKPPFPTENVMAAAHAHVERMSILFAAGCACAALLPHLSVKWMRCAMGGALVACIFVQTGVVLRNYNPTTDERLFFPSTPAMTTLQEVAGHEPVAVVGTTILPPSMNIPYGITLLANYDGMWVGRYDALYRAKFGEGNNWRPMQRASEQALELFGAKHVVTSGTWPAIDTLFPGIPVNPVTFVTTGEILAESPVVQTFTSPYESLSGLRVLFDTIGNTVDCSVMLRLRDERTGELLAEREVPRRDLVPGERGYADYVFRFPVVTKARERMFGLHVEALDSVPGRGLGVVRRTDYHDWQNQALWTADRRWKRESLDTPLPRMDTPGWQHPDLARWRLTRAGDTLVGGLVMDLAFDPARRVHERSIGPYEVWNLANVAPYRVVTKAISVSTRAEARRWLDFPEFDPAHQVTIEGLDADSARATLAQPDEVSIAEVTTEDPTHVSMKVTRGQPGWLVTHKPWINGWKARVNGEPARVACANEAFVAVAVGAGNNTIELVYDPWTVKLGVVLGLCGVVGLILCLCSNLFRSSTR